jgi:thioredoxin-dependent peroxiredoxin
VKKGLLILFCAAIIIIKLNTLSVGEEKMLSIGSVAPDFSLVTEKGDTVHLADFKGKKNVVLIFYPGDQTPGCTKQLCAIRDDFSQFEAKNAVVYGVNPAGKESHQKFIDKQHYQFSLLIDKDKKVAQLYGAKGLMVKRTVVVIDKEGTIAYYKQGMPPNSEILAAIKDEKDKK